MTPEMQRIKHAVNNMGALAKLADGDMTTAQATQMLLRAEFVADRMRKTLFNRNINAEEIEPCNKNALATAQAAFTSNNP